MAEGQEAVVICASVHRLCACEVAILLFDDGKPNLCRLSDYRRAFIWGNVFGLLTRPKTRGE